MADPTSDISKWISFGWDAKSSAIIALAKIITEYGKSNPDYALFAPEWFPAYGNNWNPTWGKMVDPDLVEPYVNAWLKYAVATKATYNANLAKNAMVNAGFDATKSQVVANAMWHLKQAGKMPTIIESPAGWASTSGIGLTDAARAIETMAGGYLTLTKMLPWIAVAVGAFVAWPYIAAARAPGRAAQKTGGLL